MSKYIPTIGIEVHAELKTKSKMFCGCKNEPHTTKPNTNICPVCMAHPGTLPSVNKDAVKKVLLVGEALNGKLATYSEFDRKNYFYPDIPKAYQLSQYEFPFVQGGELAGVSITRVHLEEDTARSQHSDGTSLVDFNRAGVPLMELVTEPVIHDAETAGNFARELQLLLRTLGVSDANMEKGEMRVEANISISENDELGTKVEVKNLNSFKVVEQAIIYEVKRQAELLERGEVVKQETRGWDENKAKTFSQRSKETAQDYRYFPDPDIPKYDLTEIEEFSSSRLNEKMPELPKEIRLSLIDKGIKSGQIEILLGDKKLLELLKEVEKELNKDDKKLQLASNYITSDIVSLLGNDNDPHKLLSNASGFAKLVNMLAAGELTSRVAKDLLAEVVFEGGDPTEIAKEKGLLQDNSVDSLQIVVDSILSANPAVVDEYKSGKESVLQFLVGQGMKETKGSANPAMLAELIKKAIN